VVAATIYIVTAFGFAVRWMRSGLSSESIFFFTVMVFVLIFQTQNVDLFVTFNMLNCLFMIAFLYSRKRAVASEPKPSAPQYQWETSMSQLEITEADDIRLIRERDYHNQRFENETREAQAKYYAAIKDGTAEFNSELVRLARSADVLEYGCGSAPTLFDVTGFRTGKGIDISDLAVAQNNKQAEKDGLRNIRFDTMNAEQMTFDDNSFDLVFGKGILHHLDIERSFSEIARVLRPGGTAMFLEPMGHNVVMNLYRSLTPSARTSDEHPLLRGDFSVARHHFGDVALTFYGLATLLSVPFRDTRIGDSIFNVTRLIDRTVFLIRACVGRHGMF